MALEFLIYKQKIMENFAGFFLVVGTIVLSIAETLLNKNQESWDVYFYIFPLNEEKS